MNITHDSENAKFIAVTDDGKHMGEIAYSPCEGRIAATHTRVDDAYRGQGVAQALLDRLAEYAIEKNMKIEPICSYVTSAFERYPQRYEKVIPEQ